MDYNSYFTGPIKILDAKKVHSFTHELVKLKSGIITADDVSVNWAEKYHPQYTPNHGSPDTIATETNLLTANILV